MIRILVIDDHPVVRRGLIQILMEEVDDAVVGEAASAGEALALLCRERWDLLVLDIALPDRSGLELLPEVRAQWPSLPVLVLSIYPEDQFAVRALKAGASGYLNKESAADELATAVRKLLNGGRHMSLHLLEQLVTEFQNEDEKLPHERLSNREFEVLRLIARGVTITEIAHQLCLSVKTVSTYHTRLLEKMQMQNNAELIAYAVRHGLAT